MFTLKMPFESLEMAVYKCLCADNPAVSEIPGPVPEPVSLVQLEIPLLFLVEPIKAPFFIHEFSIIFQTFPFRFNSKFRKSEIQGQEPILVSCLYMISEGTEAIFLRPFHNTYTYRVEIKVERGQANNTYNLSVLEVVAGDITHVN